MKALKWEALRPYLVALLIFTFGLSLSVVMQSREQAQTVQFIAGRQTSAIANIEEIRANQREILANQARIIELLEEQQRENQERTN